MTEPTNCNPDPLADDARRYLQKPRNLRNPGERLPQRLHELEAARLVAALSEVIDPAALGEWFDQPNEAFDGLKPTEVIERGEIDRLLEDGVPAALRGRGVIQLGS